MKKIIALAVVGLGVVACDPYNSEKAASAIKVQLVTGRGAEIDQLVGGTMAGPWVGEAPNPGDLVATPSRTNRGRVVVITADGLLDGTSVEATPQSCLPASGWLTVTVPTGHDVANGVWYTCYYPSSATATDGGSVYIYYSVTAPGPSTAAQPIRAGRMIAGNYTFAGSVKSSSGTALPINITLSVGQVAVSSADADDEIAPGTTNVFTAALANRTPAQTNWTLSATNAAGDEVTGAAAGSIGAGTGTDTVTYTAPATVPAGGLTVTVVATANRLQNAYSILVK